MSATKTFAYETVDREGRHNKGTLDAASSAAAAAQLRQQGLVPVAVVDNSSVLRRDLSMPGFGQRVKQKDLAVFARQFAAMSASGMSLLGALAVLEDQVGRPALAKAIAEVRSDISGGVSLSAAMGKHSKVFPTLMVAMIKAGETGGFLDGALERIATNLEKDAALRSKIKSAMTYPVIVLGFTAVLIAGVLKFIVPVFEGMFTQLGGELPVPTKVVVGAAHSLVWTGPLIVGLTVFGSAFMRHQLRRSPGFRLAVDRFKLRLPVFGPLFTKIAISRFSRNLGTLLDVGVPVLQALDVVGATTGNQVIAEAMKDLQDTVRAGRPMSSRLAQHPIFPRMVTQMIEVGEESGEISQMLSKVADFYDREVDGAAEALTASIEPIMVLVMGVVVGGMIICLYLPMFSVYQNIQGAQ